MEDNKKRQKNAEKFVCEYCNFKCCKKSDWDRHILRPKHKKNENDNKNDTNDNSKTPNDLSCLYKCECGKDITYYDFDKPERLQKCFECQEKAR